MSHATIHESWAAKSNGTKPYRTLTLHSLLDQSATELERLYLTAGVPDLSVVQGDLRGKMLAWPILADDGLVSRSLHVLASSKYFPWRGKSFHANPDQITGEGKNRIFNDRIRLFRFTTFVGRSRAGNFGAIQLNYDHPDNPRPIRAIKDEIREISKGLYLGQAYLVPELLMNRGEEKPNRAKLILYFALALPQATSTLPR